MSHCPSDENKQCEGCPSEGLCKLMDEFCERMAIACIQVKYGLASPAIMGEQAQQVAHVAYTGILAHIKSYMQNLYTKYGSETSTWEQVLQNAVADGFIPQRVLEEAEEIKATVEKVKSAVADVLEKEEIEDDTPPSTDMLN